MEIKLKSALLDQIKSDFEAAEKRITAALAKMPNTKEKSELLSEIKIYNGAQNRSIAHAEWLYLELLSHSQKLMIENAALLRAVSFYQSAYERDSEMIEMLNNKINGND